MAAAAARVALLYDERMCAHATPDGEDHPENPERLRAIWRKLDDEGVVSRCVVLKAKEAEDKHIASVHSQNHIKLVKKISSKKYDSRRNKIAKKFNSIYFNKGSSKSALLAAGSVVEVAEKVAAGELSSAIALVRPPGHHAEHDKAMGFCLFNNVAVAANYLLNKRTDLGIKKILIVDWDVHHGNATQKMFYDDPRVLTFSVHRFDYGSFYPYEADGSHSFIGEEAGRGYNINVPWEHGKCGDADYIAAWDHVLLPVTEAFDPDIILVSAGFDAALGDPLGGCCITPNGYALLLTKLLGFAKGRIVMALEGGYNLRSLANSVFVCAKVLLGDKFTFNSPTMLPFEATLRVIQAVRNELKTCWPVLSNNLSEIVSMTRPSPSEVHCPTLVGVPLGLSSHTWPILEETKARCKRKRGNNTSLPATLEHSTTCFNQGNPTDRRQSQRTMKAVHRQVTCSVAEDEELTQAEDPIRIQDQVEDSVETIIDDFEADDDKTDLYTSPDLLGCHLQGTPEERRLPEDEDVICTPVHVSRTFESSLQNFSVHDNDTQSSDLLQKTANSTEGSKAPNEPEHSLEAWRPQEDEDVIRMPVHVSRTCESSLQNFPVYDIDTQSSDLLRKTANSTEGSKAPNESEHSLRAWSPREDKDVIHTPVHVSRIFESSLQNFPVHDTQSSDLLLKTANSTEGSKAPNVKNGSTLSSDFRGSLVPTFSATERKNLKQHKNRKPQPLGGTIPSGLNAQPAAACIPRVEERLYSLLDVNGGISKRKDATNGYLKLLVMTAAEGGSAGGTSESMRDLSLILEALLKTKSHSVLLDIINKNGLQMLHIILKQNRYIFHRTPITRKLLKVFEFLAQKGILTSEHINGGPRCAGAESFRDSMLSLTRHHDVQVHQNAWSFRDRWITRNNARSEPTEYPHTSTFVHDIHGTNMRSIPYARARKRQNGEVETELKDLLARSEDTLKVEQAEVVDLKRNVSLVKDLEAKEGLKENTASKKNRDELEDTVSRNIDLQTQLNEAVRARKAAEEERQKAETRANANPARVVGMGKELRDCMGPAKVARVAESVDGDAGSGSRLGVGAEQVGTPDTQLTSTGWPPQIYFVDLTRVKDSWSELMRKHSEFDILLKNLELKASEQAKHIHIESSAKVTKMKMSQEEREAQYSESMKVLRDQVEELEIWLAVHHGIDLGGYFGVGQPETSDRA